MNRLLVFDPSGNFSDREGKGITGWALFTGEKLANFGRIKAEDHDSIETYWQSHLLEVATDIIVCESYKLQPGKAMQQSWSALETPQLIGYLRMTAWINDIPFEFQDPSIKKRFSDEVLDHMGITEFRSGKRYMLGRLSVDHERDAVRHGLYYLKYGKGKTK